MAAKLTKRTSATASQSKINALTANHSEYFKVLFSYQINKKYSFNSLFHNNGKKLTNKQLLLIYKALGNFVDKTVGMTITDVEKIYGRPAFKIDTCIDPDTNEQCPVQHLCLFDDPKGVRKFSDSVRLHGYFKPDGGYFVVTRLDWHHKFGTT